MKSKSMYGQGTSSGSYKITLPDSTDAAILGLQNLGFQVSRIGKSISPSPSLHTIQIEALRAALWMYSAQGSQSVHINRLLPAVQRLMKPIWEYYGKIGKVYQLSQNNDAVSRFAEERDDSIQDEQVYRLHRDALDELEAIGDIVALPRGYWLPAPLRAIQLPESKHWLLIGGIPAYRFPAPLRVHLKQKNCARFLLSDPAVLGLPCMKQSFDDWCDLPEEPLLDWARRILHKTTLDAAVGDEAGMHLYIPTLRGLQAQRWSSNIARIPDGRYFARTRSGLEPVYWIAELKRGKVVKKGVIEWGKRDPLRLCYGLDAIAGNPISITKKQHKGDYVFDIASPLPYATQRLLIALGQTQNRNENRYYPCEWAIPSACVADVESAFDQLSIHLETKR